MGIDLATWRARIGLNYYHMCRPLQTRWRSSGGQLYQPGVASWGVGEVMNDTSLVFKGCMTVVALSLILQYVVHSWSKLKARGGGGKVRQWWRTTFQVKRTVDGGGTLLIRAIVVVISLLLVIAGDVETNPGPEEPTLQKLLNELHSVQASWFNIGLEFGIPHTTLNSFKQMYTNPLDLMREMLMHWLDKAVDPRPTWEAVVKALRSPIVEMQNVAEQLELKYCAPVHYMREESNTSSRMEECEVVHDQTTASSSEERSKRKFRVSESSTTSEARHSDGTTSPTPSEGPQKPPFGCGCGKCTFLGFIERGCPSPIPSASSFRYLNLSGLTHRQQQELRGRLQFESQQIMMRFQELVSGTMNSFIRRNVSQAVLVSHVMTLGAFKPVFKEPQMPLFQYCLKELEAADSIPRIFLVLKDYFSFFNYHIIEHIIEELGTEEDKQRLQTYKEEFSKYAKRRIFECQPEFGAVSDADHADIFVKLDPKCENYTITEIEVFRHKLSEILRVSSQGVLRLCQVVEGCFQLTFQVPSFVQQAIFPLSRDQEMLLKTECVIALTCGEYQFLDNEDFVEKSMQEIDVSVDDVEAFPPVQKKLDADAKPQVDEVEAFPPVQKKLKLDTDAKPEVDEVEAFPPVQKKLKLDTDAKPEYLTKLHTVEGEDIYLTKYGGYLRNLYDTEQHLVGIGSSISAEKFLPFKLAKIEKGTIYQKEKSGMDEFTGQTLRGDMDDVGTHGTEFYKKSPIEVEEVGKLSNHQQLTLILIEGAAGVGKTTFSWDFCRKWSRGEILQEHSLLLLLPLRDNNLKQAKTLSDLFYHPNSELQQAVVQEVTSNQGQGVAIWLEAWDELDREPRENSSVFLDLIQGRVLPLATVFVTSRPWATELLRDKYGPHITQHVEIVTSAKNQIEYISEVKAEAQPSSFADKFTDYLSSNPVIRAAMYTPVTAKMAAEVFTWSQHTETPPPTTMTELLTAFTLKTLVDYLSTHPVYQKQQLKVTTFSDLPTDVYKQFQDLCRMAYEGILNRQQLVFSAACLPTEFAPLGLMKEVHQLYTEAGASSYHFIHLTLQEYLAAVHISQLPAQEQTRLFQKHVKSGHFKMTIKFWAGLTKLVNMAPNVTRSLMESDETKLTFFHFLFEAKNILVITESLGLDEIVVKPQYSWIPLDYYVTGHAISHSNCLWRLYFSSSSIDDEKFELFCKGCAAPCENGCRGHIVHANFSENNITSNSIQSFANVPSCIIQKMKELELHHNKLDGNACDMLAKSIPSMFSLRRLWLNNNSIESGGAVKVIKALCDSEVKQLWLNDTRIGVPDCEALCELLKSNCSLEELKIYGNKLSSESIASIITGLGHNSSLTKLNISNSQFSMANVNSLASVLKYHSKCTLTKLKLRDCRISSKSAVELATGLCKNTTLKHLDLSHNPIGAGVTAVAEMLAEVHGSHSNFTLTQLELRECHISGQGATELAAALCKNSTLKYLNLNYNAVGVEGASSISDMLQHNKSLEVLNLRSESVGEEGVHQLINSLKNNKTLKKLCLPNDYKPENSDDRIEWY